MKIPRWFPVVALLLGASLLSGCGLTGSSSSGPGLTITTSALPAATISVSYSGTLQASGGKAPYSWSVTGGTLPDGLSLASAGEISGTPTQKGNFTFQTQVKDSSGHSSSTNFSLQVTGPPPGISSVSPETGSTSGGTSVTISGKNLQSGATVTFGGIAGTSVDVTSSSQMTAVTPAHAAGSVDVVVTNPSGKSATLAGGFGYGSAAPSVSGISPNTGPTTGGTAVKISGANFLAGAIVLFAGIQATSVAVTAPTQIEAVSPAGQAGSVDVTVKNPDGQTATLSGGFTYNTDATGSPTISDLSPSSGPAGTQTLINGSNFASGATVSFGGTQASSVQFVSTNQLSVVVPSISTGTYNVTVDDPGGATDTLSSGFQVTTPQSLLSGCTVNASNQPVCGGSVGTAAVPSGWTLVQAESFEGGKVANSNTEVIHGGSITCSFSHDGSCSFEGNYVSDGSNAYWMEAGSAIGSSHDVYLSFWEYLQPQMRMFSEMFVGRFYIKNSTASQDEIVDYFGPNTGQCTGGTGPDNDYACTDAQLLLEPQGAFYGNKWGPGQVPLNLGSWRQYEIHYRANTPGNSDGIIQVYINGQLVLNSVNANLNGNVNMDGMNALVGGVFTALAYGDSGKTVCYPKGQGTMWRCSPFSACSPCPIPPNFNRYFDDIILLKK